MAVTMKNFTIVFFPQSPIWKARKKTNGHISNEERLAVVITASPTASKNAKRRTFGTAKRATNIPSIIAFPFSFGFTCNPPILDASPDMNCSSTLLLAEAKTRKVGSKNSIKLTMHKRDTAINTPKHASLNSRSRDWTTIAKEQLSAIVEK